MREPHKSPKRNPAGGGEPPLRRSGARTNPAAAAAFAALLLAGMATARAAVSVKDSVAVTRFVTPNNDNRNDRFVFKCYNPRDSKIDAMIYSISGREISRMAAISPKTGFYDILEWNPNAGEKKEGGVYIYRIAVEGKVYKGTIVVIR